MNTWMFGLSIDALDPRANHPTRKPVRKRLCLQPIDISDLFTVREDSYGIRISFVRQCRQLHRLLYFQSAR